MSAAPDSDAGLSGASALLFVSSEHSVESKWTEYELSAASGRGALIIPIIVDDVGELRLPDF